MQDHLITSRPVSSHSCPVTLWCPEGGAGGADRRWSCRHNATHIWASTGPPSLPARNFMGPFLECVVYVPALSFSGAGRCALLLPAPPPSFWCVLCPPGRALAQVRFAAPRPGGACRFEVLCGLGLSRRGAFPAPAVMRKSLRHVTCGLCRLPHSSFSAQLSLPLAGEEWRGLCG
jgi:hypothetical protein